MIKKINRILQAQCQLETCCVVSKYNFLLQVIAISEQVFIYKI